MEAMVLLVAAVGADVGLKEIEEGRSARVGGAEGAEGGG